jgi:N-acetylglutamate synthase-like GNAT family acetyltransferase
MLPNNDKWIHNDYFIRPAVDSDFIAIKSLIHAVQINPMGLKWPNFLIACDAEGNLIGCGQVKSHNDGSRELASIAVVESWRKRGIASTIILRLLEENPGTLYLTCRDILENFYTPFGFRSISFGEMPPYFRRIWRIVGLITKSGLIQDSLLVMKREPQPPG